MFLHEHPYPPYLFPEAEKLIVGTLPPPRFSTGELLEQDVDFCYGSYYNSLWLFLDEIFNLNLIYDNSNRAIEQRKNFLRQRKIGVCDIVASAEREKIDASDLGMKNIKLRDLIGYLKTYDRISWLLFTGGNSKNGPEYFFRKHIKEHQITLEAVSKDRPRIHQFELDGRIIKTVSLTSASGAANISIGSDPKYKERKKRNPQYSTFDYRVDQYKDFF